MAAASTYSATRTLWLPTSPARTKAQANAVVVCPDGNDP
jgi:hypothetical protein